MLEQIMNNAALEEHDSKVDPFTPRNRPLPDSLPGTEGLYLLTATGKLGRYQTDGIFREEPALSGRLADKIARVLRQYRSGAVNDLALALITPNTPDQPWQSSTLVFGDAAVREVFRTRDEGETPLTSFQKRNKVKSVYQGMELVLDTKKASQPQLPRYCPVLFVPEVNDETLRRRYNTGALDTRRALEVLDMMAPISPKEQQDPALTEMAIEMSKAKIAPEVRHAPELTLVENATPSGTGCETWSLTADTAGIAPWEGLPEDRSIYFNDGDPVTYWLLASFAPFNELNDLQRQFLARGHVVTKKPAGSTLIERSSREDVTIYLIEGTLELEAFDGRKISVVGGTRRARIPISQLSPHAYTVKAATDVSVILVSQDMVREVTRITTTYKSRPGIEVTEESPVEGTPGDVSLGR
jgi:hypothetical protein